MKQQHIQQQQMFYPISQTEPISFVNTTHATANPQANYNMYASATGFKELSNQLEYNLANKKHQGFNQQDEIKDKKRNINDILSNFRKEKE